MKITKFQPHTALIPKKKNGDKAQLCIITVSESQILHVSTHIQPSLGCSNYMFVYFN
jgi:hypothetical protein